MILYHVYTVALRITKLKKPHNIGETLVKPCLLECAKLVLGDTACKKLKTKARNKLALEDDMRCSLSAIKPRISALVHAN